MATDMMADKVRADGGKRCRCGTGAKTATYYRHTDGDGTRALLCEGKTATKYVNELDKDSVLTINTSNGTITISDKGDNKLVFACEQFDHDGNTGTGKEWRGRLTRLEDANGNRTNISYTSTTLTNLRVSKVQEQLKGEQQAEGRA